MLPVACCTRTRTRTVPVPVRTKVKTENRAPYLVLGTSTGTVDHLGPGTWDGRCHKTSNSLPAPHSATIAPKPIATMLFFTNRVPCRSFILFLASFACRFFLSEAACQSCVLPLLYHRRPRFATPNQPQLALVTAISSVASVKCLRSPLVRRSLAIAVVGSVVAKSVMRRESLAGIFRNSSDNTDDESSQSKEAPDQDQDKVKENNTKPPLTSAMVATIGVYKNFISPLLPPACRFLPTCSQYGVQAIEEFGPTKGAVLMAWRLLRCSPFGGKGYDPPRWPPVKYTYGSY